MKKGMEWNGRGGGDIASENPKLINIWMPYLEFKN